MPITLFDAIRRVRSDINEPAIPTSTLPSAPGPRFYSDTEITDWVNDGLRDIARRTETLITKDTSILIPAYGENPNLPPPSFPLNIGTPPNNLGPLVGPATYTDVIRINRVEFQVAGDSSQIYPLEVAQKQYLDGIWNIDQLSTMSYPAYYTTNGYPGGIGRNAFVIQMFPNSAQAGQLNIFYYRLPVRIQDPVTNPANYNVQLDLIEGWDDMVVDYAVMRAYVKSGNQAWQQSQQMYEAKLSNVIDQTRQFHDQPQYMSYDTMVMPWAYDSWGGF
jgi:hypothetical protein